MLFTLFTWIVITLTMAFIALFFIERRTIWIGILFFLWLGVFSLYAVLQLEMYWRSAALILTFILAVIFVLGFPLYLVSFVWLLISSGIKLIKREGGRLRNLLSVGLGIFLIVWMFFSPFMKFGLDQPILWRAYLFISFCVFYFFALLLCFAIASLLNRIRLPFRSYDYVVVLGSGLIGDQVPPLLASRIDKGIDLFRRYHSSASPVKIIFSGGQGHGERLSEGEAMAKYARLQGVGNEHIIIEDQAMDTYENLLFSKKLMELDAEERGMTRRLRTVIVTNNFHTFRAQLWARKVKMKSDVAGSKTKLYFWLNASIREFIGMIALQKKYHLIVLGIAFLVSIAFVLLNPYIVRP